VGSRLPPSVVRFGAAPISGFFPLHDAADGKSRFASQMREVYTLHDSAAGVNARCAASKPPTMRWKCIAANESYAHSTTPFFILQSILDSVALRLIWNDSAVSAHDCLAPGEAQFASCGPMQVRALNRWAAGVLADVTRPAKARGAREGGFVEACLEHVQGQGRPGFTGYRLRNTSMGEALSAWWASLKPDDDSPPLSTGTGNWYRPADPPLSEAPPVQRCRSCALR
jgi:hypothetical protein